MSSAVATPDLEGQPNNTRFKVVKIDGQRSTGSKSHPKGAEDGHVHDHHILMPNGQKSFTYKRGRWTVTDFYDAPPLPHPLPPVSVPVSSQSSNSSTPSTPTLTTVLSPLSRLPAAAAAAALSDVLQHALPEPAAVCSQPTSPPVLEEIVPNPLTTAAVTSIRAAVTAAAATEGQEHPVPALAQVTSQQQQQQPPTATSPMTDVAVDAKDTDRVRDQPPLLSLPLLASALLPEEKTSQPNSDTSSVTSPTVSDLTSLAKEIRAHPDVIQSAASPVKTGSDVSSESKDDAIDRTSVTGEEMERAAASSGLVTGNSVATVATGADIASGYATPASIHSVSGANAALLPPYVSSVAIDNKIEQAMDLVKSHLMFAVREEVDVLKEKIVGLLERIQALETENAILKQSHESTNNQNSHNSANTGISEPGSPLQPVNPDSAQELASLVSEVALTSPSGSDTAAVAADAAADPVPESLVSPEEEK